jgi:hypothetical protein
MVDEFDPYRKWLGLRDPERPPNHYRLLGVDLYEDDRDVIDSAADRQMAHVRTFATGPHAALSQRILNELSLARLCLIDPVKRAAYNAQLQARQATASLAPASPQSFTEPPPSPAPLPSPAPTPPQQFPTTAEPVADSFQVPGTWSPPATSRPQASPPKSGWLKFVWMAAVLAVVTMLLVWRSVSAPQTTETADDTTEPTPSDETPGTTPVVGLGDPSRDSADAAQPAEILTETGLLEGGHTASIWSLALLNEGRELVSTGVDARVVLWDLSDRRVKRDVGKLGSIGKLIATSPSGQYIAAAGQDNTITVWQIDRAEPLAELAGGGANWIALAFARDNLGIVALSDAGRLERWSLPNIGAGETIADLAMPTVSLAMAVDGLIAVGCSDGLVRVVSQTSGELAHTLAGHSGAVTSLATSANGRLLLSGDSEGGLILWRLPEAREERRLAGLEDGIRSLAMSADGRLAIAGSDNRVIGVWDTSTGRLGKRIDDQIGQVLSVAISPDGSRGYSTAVEAVIRIWETNVPPTLKLKP